MRHGALIKRMHIDADTFRKVVDTMLQCETVAAIQGPSGAVLFYLGYMNDYPDNWTQGETLDELERMLVSLRRDIDTTAEFAFLGDLGH